MSTISTKAFWRAFKLAKAFGHGWATIVVDAQRINTLDDFEGSWKGTFQEATHDALVTIARWLREQPEHLEVEVIEKIDHLVRTLPGIQDKTLFALWWETSNLYGDDYSWDVDSVTADTVLKVPNVTVMVSEVRAAARAGAPAVAGRGVRRGAPARALGPSARPRTCP